MFPSSEISSVRLSGGLATGHEEELEGTLLELLLDASEVVVVVVGRVGGIGLLEELVVVVVVMVVVGAGMVDEGTEAIVGAVVLLLGIANGEG